MNKETRNILRNAVTEMRRKLEDAVSKRLEGYFGIRSDGLIDGDFKMKHLNVEGLANREQLLGHLEHIKSGGFNDADAVDQLKREIAFTHLNRLIAFKLMEQRRLIREAVSRGVKSPGVEYYLIQHPEDEEAFDTGHTETAYRNFLSWQAQQFEDEIGVLFAHNDPANVVYPPQLVLDEVLALINSEKLASIWTEDETIGWVYQYFTPKELRDKARESPAPRNSYELAFLNQFYTPRYVVEFLTDNTLGRTWYEMHEGDTVLKDYCRYLVRRPNEIFMRDGEEAPEMGDTSHLPQEELLQQTVFIPYRAYKDPRRLKILDPACGSGHFLLYCFDLLTIIYEEAWDRDRTDPIGNWNLRRDYASLDALRRDLPRLILRHNLHGIDIDRRATQIAALALWLRAQRYYNDYDIKRDDRPKITQGNIVLAEAMPGNKALLKEFTTTLNPPILGQLVERVFDKMQLAGELGSLLKIEEAIQDDIKQAKTLWETGPKPEQLALFPDLVTKEEIRQLSLFDVSAIDDAQFWTQTEKLVLEALEAYAQQATNGRGLQRRLFAQDAATGFAFIEVLRKRFDIVLMNPPFGVASSSTKSYLGAQYPQWNNNLLCCFIDRTISLNTSVGMTGAIYDRTAWVKLTYEDFRKVIALSKACMTVAADLGWEVLDANVEVTSNVFDRSKNTQKYEGVFLDLRTQDSSSKGNYLLDLINGMGSSDTPHIYFSTNYELQSLPNSVVGYDLPYFVRHLFANNDTFLEVGFQGYTGAQIRSEQHFSTYWEIPTNQPLTPATDYSHLYNGGEYTRFFMPPRDAILFGVNGNMVNQNDGSYTWRLRLKSTGKNYFKSGVGFGVRGEYLDVHLLRLGNIFTVEGQVIPVDNVDDAWLIAILLNSSVYQVIINSYCGQHKYSGYLNLLPSIHIDSKTSVQLINLGKQQYEDLEWWYKFDPTTLVYSGTRLFYHQDKTVLEAIETIRREDITLRERSIRNYEESNRIIEKLCDVSDQNDLVKIRDVEHQIKIQGLPFSNYNDRYYIDEAIDYAVGCILGMWDIRIVCSKTIVDVPPYPQQLPSRPPGMLQNTDGLPATESPRSYPLDIIWEGILVDDENHPDDLVRRIRDVLHLLWGDNAGNIEAEMLDILGEKSLRAYFRRSGNGGFWMNHVSRYTKSRRKAPIYWYLHSRNGNYGLWLYYHRLDGDLLFKALTNYVRPKVQELQHRVTALSGQKSDKKAQAAFEDAESMLNELLDFQAKLQRAAELGLTPDLNDGVLLNIAPLHELVPWGEAADYWNALLKGEYEWSSIGKQLKAKGLVK